MEECSECITRARDNAAKRTKSDAEIAIEKISADLTRTRGCMAYRVLKCCKLKSRRLKCRETNRYNR